MAGIDENTLLLLSGNNFIDKSFYNNIITNENVQISSTQTHFSQNNSYYFNGNARFYTPGNFFATQTNDFTIDFWAYQISGSGAFFASNGGSRGKIMMGYPAGSNNLGIGQEQVSWDIRFNTGAGTAKNIWQHLAIVRSNGVITLYVNGVASGSGNSSVNYNTTNTTYDVGIQAKGLYGSQYSYTGYIQEYRISNIARWTSNFTPPTEPYSVPSNMYVKINNVWQPVTRIYTKTNNTW